MSRLRPLSPGQAKSSLVQRFGRVADRLRQIATNKGLRPYRVFLRWTTWAEEERGDGYERDYAVVEILPTPLVTSLDSVSFSLFHAGTVPEGSIRVREISIARYSEDNLRGLTIPTFGDCVATCGCGGAVGCGVCLNAPAEPETCGSPVCDPPASVGAVNVAAKDGISVRQPLNFFYEVVEDGRHGAAERKRFRLLNTPFLNASGVEWTLMLERTSPDRARGPTGGQSPFALGQGR